MFAKRCLQFYAALVSVESITPEPAGLRALAHPVRLRILGLLRTDGPATASTLAARLGLNSGATSYHLRQLAGHGFVVDVPERGNGRDRWWRAAHRSTETTPETEATPEGRDATDAFGQAIAVVHTEGLQRAVEERPLLPESWRRASTLSDWQLRLTPQRAEELLNTLVAVVDSWQHDPSPNDRPDAAGEADGADGADVADVADPAELFTVVLHTYPRPGRLTPEADR
jgi:DNA-binding transcriptional ArsR family regulator